jgi:hypothetical protein
VADARLRGILFFGLSLGSLFACGSPPQEAHGPAAATPAEVRPPASDFAGDAAPLPRYRSKRLGLSLGLPRGAAWRIDDHSSAALVATHEPTRSRVVVAVLFADAIVGRDQCQALAEERMLVPPLAASAQTLEDEVVVTQRTFDTHIRVALDPGDGPSRPLVGHVLAFGGYLRKCYAFDFRTEVSNAERADTLSARLAFARARILGGLILDSFEPTARSLPSDPPFSSTPRIP